MAATEDRLRTLETQVEELSADLRVLRTLVEQDAASALNKIRYVTEKVLHRLCGEHGVSWGNGEPTVENMIGPLIAKKVIPKNVAIHVRTVQTNASPGSHFQETPLSATHVQVAQIALLDFLEWFYKVEGAAAAAAAPAKSKLPGWLFPALGALVAIGVGASIILYVAAHRPPDEDEPKPAAAPAAAPAPAPKPKLRSPDVGLRAIATYREPKGSEITTLDSVPFWENAARDLHDAAKQPDAPKEWEADALFCDAQGFARGGKIDESIAKFREAIAAAPKSAHPHAGLAIVLAYQGKLDDATKEAGEAERLEPAWWGAIAASARVYTIAKQYDVAIQSYRRALAAAPKHPLILSELALVYHARHLDSEAERYAKEALAADPDLLPAHLLLAERALEQRDAKTALDEATRAAAVGPDSLAATMALADAQVLAHKDQDALATFKNAVALWHQLAVHVPYEDRMKAVEAAVKTGKLPQTRHAAGKAAGTPQRSMDSESDPEPEPHRSAPCDPGNPLCGVE
jgi:tetratricopeptide (TPR) repeat protein